MRKVVCYACEPHFGVEFRPKASGTTLKGAKPYHFRIEHTSYMSVRPVLAFSGHISFSAVDAPFSGPILSGGSQVQGLPGVEAFKEAMVAGPYLFGFEGRWVFGRFPLKVNVG